MRRILFLLLAALLFSAPAAVQAMRTKIFEFAGGTINASWSGIGPIQIEKHADGIVLQTGNGTGYLLTEGGLFFPEAGTVTASSPEGAAFSFAWITGNGDGQETFSVSFILPAGERQGVSFSLSGAKEVDVSTLRLGLELPPRTAILLHQLEIHEWNAMEQVWHGILSFWRFDKYRPYSINFVWGPHLAWNPVDRSKIFAMLPPPQLSATQLAYGILLVTVIVFGAAAFYGILKTHRRTWFMARTGWILLAVWILFDLRMGGEFLSWVVHDHQTYIAADEDERIFRDRGRFYDFAEYSKQFLENREEYVFFAQRPWPYLGNMRYLTYPSIPGIDYTTDDTWVVYDRPDMTVDSDGRITIGDTPVSQPGTMLGRFDDTSFVFRVTQ